MRVASNGARALQTSVPGLAGEQHAGDLAVDDDAGLDGLDGEVAGVLQQLGGGGEGAELLEMLDGGEDELDLLAAMGLQGGVGCEPAEVDALLAVDLGLLVGGWGAR